MDRSDQINELVAAMVKAQGQIEGASKSATNPHFKSKYADLASVWEACRGPLSAAGLAIFQPVSTEGPQVTVTTLLAHTSGQFISQSLTLTAQQDTPQAVGSAITYGRRYGLSSMVGIAPEDDDGEAASKPSVSGPVAIKQAPIGYTDWLDELSAVADTGYAALELGYKQSAEAFRTYLSRDPGALMRLKAKAKAVDAKAAQ